MKYIKAIVCIFIQTACFGQTTATVSFSLYLADVATIALAPSNSTINLVVSSSVAGFSPTLPTDTNSWINFTSSVSTGNQRKITAEITSGSLPAGLELKITITGPFGTGAGTPGTISSMPLTLSSSPQDIVTGIRDATTGTGVNNGYNIKYELVITNFGILRAGNTNISIKFTIT
jgi:hypothetical protein